MSYLSIVEASNRLHCTTKTVLALVNSGHLWAKKEADDVMVIESDSITDLVCSDKFSVIQNLSASSADCEDTPVPRPLIKVGHLLNSTREFFATSPLQNIK